MFILRGLGRLSIGGKEFELAECLIAWMIGGEVHTLDGEGVEDTYTVTYIGGFNLCLQDLCMLLQLNFNLHVDLICCWSLHLLFSSLNEVILTLFYSMNKNEVADK